MSASDRIQCDQMCLLSAVRSHTSYGEVLQSHIWRNAAAILYIAVTVAININTTPNDGHKVYELYCRHQYKHHQLAPQSKHFPSETQVVINVILGPQLDLSSLIELQGLHRAEVLSSMLAHPLVSIRSNRFSLSLLQKQQSTQAVQQVQYQPHSAQFLLKMLMPTK